MNKNILVVPLIASVCLLFSGCFEKDKQQAGAPMKPSAHPDKSLLLNPNDPEWKKPAPALFDVTLKTTKGDIVIECHRDWAPLGADRFYTLARSGYFDNNKFFRVMPGWVQWGIGPEPKISQAWRTATFPDDPRKIENARGTVAFAYAVPNGRTTQIFINMQDNQATHDSQLFAPFGKVIKGMDIAASLYGGYRENSGGGIRAGKQDGMFEKGNAWFEPQFPNLDTLISASVTPK